MNDIALQQNVSGFSFKNLLATLFLLRLRDKLSAKSQDGDSAVWGM